MKTDRLSCLAHQHILYTAVLRKTHARRLQRKLAPLCRIACCQKQHEYWLNPADRPPELQVVNTVNEQRRPSWCIGMCTYLVLAILTGFSAISLVSLTSFRSLPSTPPPPPRQLLLLLLLLLLSKEWAVRLLLSSLVYVVGHSTSSHPKTVTAGTRRPLQMAPTRKGPSPPAAAAPTLSAPAAPAAAPADIFSRN